MKHNGVIPEKLITNYGQEIEEIFRRAVKEALWRHKRLGQSIAASRDGKVVIIPPEEIPVEDEPPHQLMNKHARDAREIEIINRNAERLNAEALDVLDYQVIREVENEV